MIRLNRPQQWSRSLSFTQALLGATLSALAAMAGCAGQGDIDRTQPDKVDKSIFFNADGTAKIFYYRPTIVEVPPTTSGPFEGFMGSMEKIRFDITEAALIGYRAYDWAPGSENAITGGANNTDTPILIFPIKSHFDVKREYNAGTGEQTNVISENTSDRPPLQRQYMRLDWSLYSDAEIASQYRPIITPDYFEITDKAAVGPDATACATFNVFDDAAWDCGNAEIKVRHSFMAVKPSNYQPLEYPDRQPLLDANGNQIQLIQDFYPCTGKFLAQAGGAYSGADCAPASVDEFSKFGFFRTVRQTYDRRVGATEDGRKYYINRWNIWGPDVPKLGDDGKMLLDQTTKQPLMRHSTRQIVYYTNVEWPDDPALLETAKAVAGDWNATMRETVAALDLTDANPGHAVDPGELATRLAVTGPNKIDDIVILKTNSCNLADVQKILNANADLAHLVETKGGGSYGAPKVDASHLTKANLVQACSIMEAATQNLDAKDPKKFTWQRNGDLRYSFFHWVDRPQVSGPLGYGPSSADPETGEIISASLYNYGAALDTYSQMSADTVELLNGQISIDDILSGNTILDVLQSTAAQHQARTSKPLTDEAKSYMATMAQPNSKDRLVPIAPGASAAKIESLKGTLLERMLMNNDILPAVLPPDANAQNPDSLTDAQMEAARPANWLTQKARDKRRDAFTKASMNGCVFKAEFADDAILGLALELKQQGLNKDEIFAKLRASIFRGLAGHEMGHTMGLRHNFSGSTDALNYNDNYWSIRTTKPQAMWASSKLNEYQYSTVMDYGARFNSDVNGLGKYDHAAIRFGYGQLIDLMPETTTSGSTGLGLQNFIFTTDYTKLPTFVGGVNNLQNGSIARYSAVNSNLAQAYADPSFTGGQFLTMERPYKFCSDEFVGSLDCKPWDLGANQTEIVNNTIDQFKNYYLFNAFKRGRINWSLDGYMNRLSDRYFSRFTEAFQFYYYLQGAPSLQGTDLINDLAKASVDSLNTLGEILQTPEPGMHCATQSSPNILVLPQSRGANSCITGQPTMNIDLPNGKPYYIDFSGDYYYRITRAGSLYEKLQALVALTTTEARFFRVDSFADQNRFSINYYRIFKDQMLNLFSGVIRNDPSVYGAYAAAGQFTNTPVVDVDILGKVTYDMPPYMKPDAKRIATPVNKTIRYFALGLALSQLDSTWDSTLDISNYLAVTQKGAVDDTVFSVPVHEFTHPESGVTYRAPQFDNKTVGIGVQVIDDLNAMTGKVGVEGTLSPQKFGTLFIDHGDGTFDQPLIPDFYTAKAKLDAAKASGNQTDYSYALNAFQTVQTLMAYQVDLLNDLRTFRRAFAF
ncbi:MAG TPA: zinc-dependent metalloprotease [Polyangia bacterium]|nr:zinc-dependent metalloprotease [Polyangia bacterium]